METVQTCAGVCMPCGFRPCLHHNPFLFQTFFPNYSILTLPSHELYCLYLNVMHLDSFEDGHFFLQKGSFPSIKPSLTMKADSTLRGIMTESERLYLFELVILTRLMAQGNLSWLLARDSLEIKTRIKTASSDPDYRCSDKRVWWVVQKREIEIRSIAVRAMLGTQARVALISAGHGRQCCCVSRARVCSLPPSTVEKTHKLQAVTEAK